MPKRFLQRLFSRDNRHDGAILPALPDLEARVGQPAVEYSLLVGHKQRHYSEIYVDPVSMPKISLTEKPDNNLYLAMKRALLDDALRAVSPYLSFVSNLDGMAGHKNLGEHLLTLTRLFLARFWDMPASQNNHHHYPWGLALHSLEVACGEAEQGSRWTPMTASGLDDVRKSRELGMVVLLHFARGLLHDAHKRYQYSMVCRTETPPVTFDPFYPGAAILDFKLVYPKGREEFWLQPKMSAAELNILEFWKGLPEEIVSKAPGDVFMSLMTSVNKMEEIAADKESAKKDCQRLGQPILEELIADAVREYLTTERGKTKPENHVYAATPQWFAVHTTHFFGKIRPGHGIHSAEGVRTCFIEQDLLYGTGRNDLKIPFLIRKPDGTERFEDNQRLVFLRSDYLLDIHPTIADEVGEIHFLARDENLVSQFCPHFRNYIKDWPASVTGEVAVVQEGQEKTAKPDTQVKGEKAVPAEKPKPDKEQSSPPTSTAEQPAAVVEDSHPQAPEPKQKQLVKTEQIDWVERFERLLDGFSLEDTNPGSGWIFLTPIGCYLRHPAFFKAILPLESVDERRAIIHALQKGGYAPTPYEGDIECLQPDGMVKISGSFINVALSGPVQVALIMKINAPKKTAESV
ncbi:hypothetical protein LJB81_02075 [Desulfovibrio sp. OttesenSCG-928-M14]|nr:hypothetical protein [Desulfovibrio sp. OttesenSCG-928-M14]